MLEARFGWIYSSGLLFPLTAAVIFLLLSLLFKLAAVPAHLWIPEVYSAVSAPVLAFLVVPAKITILLFFVLIAVKIFTMGGTIIQLTPEMLNSKNFFGNDQEQATRALVKKDHLDKAQELCASFAKFVEAKLISLPQLNAERAETLA